MILDELFELIKERKKSSPTSSYVAALYEKGDDAILQKVGEEAIETILAFKSEKRDEIIYESADLIFHLLVALSNADIELDELFKELESRFGTSGIRKE
ncbi:MAG: phosphoribosyl-ATP diphosphatase [Nitrospinota bacterium]